VAVSQWREVWLSDPVTMRLLAHPLRLRIMGSLRLDGPATSAMLARRLDTDTGQTSFHLRQLGKHGLIEDAPERGKGRERWWQSASESTRWDPDMLAQAGETDTLELFEDAALAAWDHLIRQYRRERRQRGPGWDDGASFGDYPLRTTPQGLRDLYAELVAVIRRHDLGDEIVPGAQDALVILHAFPRPSSP
jgi:DNA-binding transcriptional ArsR family regulator